AADSYRCPAGVGQDFRQIGARSHLDVAKAEARWIGRKSSLSRACARQGDIHRGDGASVYDRKVAARTPSRLGSELHAECCALTSVESEGKAKAADAVCGAGHVGLVDSESRAASIG